MTMEMAMAWMQAPTARTAKPTNRMTPDKAVQFIKAIRPMPIKTLKSAAPRASTRAQIMANR
jgi:hypothetical protein